MMRAAFLAGLLAAGPAAAATDAATLIDLLDEVYRTGQSYIGKRVSLFLKRQADREPEETILDFVLQPIIENEGNVTGIFVQGVDVTERVLAQQAAPEHAQLVGGRLGRGRLRAAPHRIPVHGP